MPWYIAVLAVVLAVGISAVIIWSDRQVHRAARRAERDRHIRQLERDLGFIDPPWISDPSQPRPEPGPSRPIWR